jgi:hypothetical protein
MRKIFKAVLVATLALTAGAVEASAAGSTGFMRGMVVSCPRAGQIWGSPEMTESLRDISELGVEWVSIHPYAGVRRDGTIRRWEAIETGYLGRAGELVRDARMRLFWKPHLAYWGSFEWRGAIDFGDDRAAWSRFFEGYESFIVDQAAAAQRANAELFAVGVELERTTHFAEEWTRIIAAVREVYDGRITYAANWDSLDSVPFWDLVDLIGVHAYFPLSEAADPSRDELWGAWEAPLATLDALSQRHGGKSVVFAEIGYNRSRDAARAPWKSEMSDSEASRRLRRRLIEVALERIEAEPLIRGMFWWKWIPGDFRYDRDFSMRNPEAKEALTAHWAGSENRPKAPALTTPQR